jgi:hypothetical protein
MPLTHWSKPLVSHQFWDADRVFIVLSIEDNSGINHSDFEHVLIVWSTVRHAIHLQFNISANALDIRSVQSPKCIVWCAVDCTVIKCFKIILQNKFLTILSTSNLSRLPTVCCYHRISIPAYAIEQQWWQLGVPKNEMSLMSFIFKIMLVLYQSTRFGKEQVPSCGGWVGRVFFWGIMSLHVVRRCQNTQR